MKAKQIIVGKAETYAAKVGGGTIASIHEINSLVTGAIAVFTEAGVLVTTANKATVLADQKRVIIAVGNQQTNAAALAFITLPIPRVGTNAKKDAYTAPVKAIKWVGKDSGGAGNSLVAGMPTFAVGNEIILKIINTTPGLRTLGAVEGQEVFRYSQEGRPGDTNNTMITKLIAKINADPDRIVNAAVEGTQVGIKLTARDYDTTFKMAVDGGIEGATFIGADEATVGASTAIVYGVGTSDQVAALEDLYMTLRGKTNRLELTAEHFKHPSLVVAGETYDIYTLSWDDARTSAMEGAQGTGHFDVLVALPAGESVVTAFETIIAEVFNGVATETGSF